MLKDLIKLSGAASPSTAPIVGPMAEASAFILMNGTLAYILMNGASGSGVASGPSGFAIDGTQLPVTR